jgi:hypothetical protein
VELKKQFLHDNRTFEVEKILDHRVNEDKEEFLVKWLGFDNDQVTWEPADILNEDVPVLVAKFMKADTSKRKLLQKGKREV